MLENGYTCFETHFEERVSQNVDIGLSLNVLACRSGGFKKNTKNITKVTRFLLYNEN